MSSVFSLLYERRFILLGCGKQAREPNIDFQANFRKMWRFKPDTNAMNLRFDRNAGARGWWLVPIACWAVSAWQFQYAGIHMDTARDWAYALDIATGTRFHLLGPDIARAAHLGPLWYYLLAIPLAIGADFSDLARCVAVLFGSQFWFAYRLGVRATHSTLGGALAAIALTLPNWSAIYMAGVTHTLMTVPALLGALLATWRWTEKKSVLRAATAGFACSVALHAHPTTLLCLGLLLSLILFAEIPAAQKSRQFVATIIATTSLFLPVLISYTQIGFEDGVRLQSYARDVSLMGNVSQFPRVAIAMIADAPRVQIDLIASNEPITSLSIVVWILALGIALFGALLPPPRSRGCWPIALASTIVIASTLMVSASRPFVTFYMLAPAFALLPLLVAFGWQRAPAALSFTAIAMLMFLHVAWAIVLSDATRRNELNVNLPRVLFVGKSNTERAQPLGPIWAQAEIPELARFLCARPRASLHGVAVPGIDLLAEVLMRRDCPATQRPQLGGGETIHAHWLSVPCSVANFETRTGGVCWHQPLRTLAATAFAVADTRVHPPRRIVDTPDKLFVAEFALHSNEILVVTNHLMEWSFARQWSIARRDGSELPAIVKSPWYQIVRCPTCAPEGEKVRISVKTPSPHLIDIAVIPQLP